MVSDILVNFWSGSGLSYVADDIDQFNTGSGKNSIPSSKNKIIN